MDGGGPEMKRGYEGLTRAMELVLNFMEDDEPEEGSLPWLNQAYATLPAISRCNGVLTRSTVRVRWSVVVHASSPNEQTARNCTLSQKVSVDSGQAPPETIGAAPPGGSRVSQLQHTPHDDAYSVTSSDTNADIP